MKFTSFQFFFLYDRKYLNYFSIQQKYLPLFFHYVQEEQGIQHIYNEKATTFVLNFFQRKAVFYLHLSCRFIMMEIINWLTAGCWQRFGIFRVVFFFSVKFYGITWPTGSLIFKWYYRSVALVSAAPLFWYLHPKVSKI